MWLSTFLKGLASIFDFSGSLSRYDDLYEHDDNEALRKDWEAVGKDIYTATRQAKDKVDESNP